MSQGRRRWDVIAGFLALPAVAVLAVIVVGLLGPGSADMQHIRGYVLPVVIPNTVSLVLLVVMLATMTGTFCAWLVVFYEFPGRRFFNTALLLPLAFPGYVLAFIYLGLFDYAGPVQTFFRERFGVHLDTLTDSALPGVTLVLVCALYPYVFLLARSGFASQGQRAREVAWSCQLGSGSTFFRAVLPLSAPWIMGGALLVAMETLADFGAVAVFNYDTFTTAIYKSWFSLFSIGGALRLAGYLLVFVMVLVLCERYFAYRKSLALPDGGAIKRSRLSPGRRWSATLALATLWCLAFLLPAVQLLIWSFGEGATEWQSGYFELLGNSLTLGLLAMLTIVAVAVLLAYAHRQSRGMIATLAVRVAGLGYALPGALLAVGVVIAWTSLQAALTWLTTVVGDTAVAVPVTQGFILVMLVAYLVRFCAVALSPIENGMMRIPAAIDDSSRVLGVGGLGMLRKVYAPMLSVSLLTAALLVFVDVLKEMPITLMTRPFGWDTLAVRVFERTAEAQWAEAAPAALMIVGAGILPVLFLTRRIEHAIGH